MKAEELRKKYLDFFKKHDHKIIPSSSLIPENDPTVLFTTAGMHPLVPFLLGQPHPLGNRIANVQKCIRTGDIEEVGDKTHHTFFEMLGNWSFGDYFKKEAITLSYEFLINELKIPKEKLAVTCFKGDKDAPKDSESENIWLSLSIPKERIAFLDKESNWWPAGGVLPGPQGPDTEMFVWTGNKSAPKKFNPNDANWVEIWNDVFMEYNCKDKKYTELKKKNVDTGFGLERALAILNNETDNYRTELFFPIIKKIEFISKKPYEKNEKEMRVIADHIKASVFILAEGIQPSNLDRGYVLRRLIRRAVRYAKKLDIKSDFTKHLAEVVIEIYKKPYPELNENKDFILAQIEKEENAFSLVLEKGLRQFEKMIKNNILDGKSAFILFTTYGFPFEMTKELAEEKGCRINEKEFRNEMEKHQELSRTATKGKFKSGLGDDSQMTIKLHTASHLLLSALKKVLKDSNISQKGSNINPERLRLDFNFPRKLTEEEIKQTENLVNQKIKEAILVKREEMSLKEAQEKGASGAFLYKYGDRVSVYMVGDFSREICAGPHVNNTKELKHFKILKEESVSSGVRRIKAVLE